MGIDAYSALVVMRRELRWLVDFDFALTPKRTALRAARLGVSYCGGGFPFLLQ